MSAPHALAGEARPKAMPPRILVLGYGNPGRRDDGLGPAVVNAIAAEGWAGVTTWENDQLTIEDAIDIAAHDVVWFVDAARGGEEPVHEETVVPALEITFSSHILSPGTLLAIAQREFGAMPEAHLLAIRGYDFSFEEGLTEAAVRNLAHAVELLGRRIAASRGGAP